MSKVLVFMSSPRKQGNTDRLCDAFIKGVRKNYHEVEKIYVHYQHIQPCLGCRMCQHNQGQCVQKDDMQDIYHKMAESDVIAFASPVYFYTWNASMKLLIDRSFALEKYIHDKRFYLLSTGLAPDESYFQIMKDSFQKYVHCLRAGGNQFVDYVFACQTGSKNDIENTDALKSAYELGKGI